MLPSLAIALLAACGPVEVEEPADCPTGTCIEGELGSYSLDVAEEIDGVCFSWTIGNDEPLLVNAVHAENDGYFHHSNWFWVPESDWDLPDGPWNCWENDFAELEATIRGGVLFAQSTQLPSESQQFLPGYVIEIPPRSRIIAYAHLQNWSGAATETALRTRLDLVHPDDLIAKLAPWRFTYNDLAIPPGGQTVHAGRCEVREFYESVSDEPFDLRVHYALPHFHDIGRGFTMQVEGGPRHGESLLELRDAWGHPFGTTFPEPIDLSDANGLRFSCEHDNPRDEEVGWGIGDQEMCVALLFTESSVMLDTSVRETTATSEDDQGTLREGDCFVIGAPFER